MKYIPLALAVCLGAGIGYAAAIGGAAEAIRLANSRTEAAKAMLSAALGDNIDVGGAA